ncbi:C4-type zinc ribbon domain-containing protein [Mycobacterium sp. NPDC006124]|uniref:zinc ribbon domain-containing protein n=1 Tax=Mycobacterium sp. NPDC006124 TaxID=3156729 RepID=UPI0033BD537F
MKAEESQQRLVLEIAAVDAELSRLDHRGKHLEEQQRLDAVTAEHRAATDALATLTIALEDLDGQVAKFEGEIDAVRKREDRDRGLLDGGTVDVKHVGEIQHELEALQRRQESLEDSLLEIMERREQLQKELAEQQARIDGMQTDLTAATAARNEVLVQIDQSRHEAVARREELSAAAPAELVALYERQRAQGGIGAGRLQGRRCGACRIEIDRGELARISAAREDEVLRCPECSAILVRVRDFTE